MTCVLLVGREPRGWGSIKRDDSLLVTEVGTWAVPWQIYFLAGSPKYIGRTVTLCLVFSCAFTLVSDDRTSSP